MLCGIVLSPLVVIIYLGIFNDFPLHFHSNYTMHGVRSSTCAFHEDDKRHMARMAIAINPAISNVSSCYVLEKLHIPHAHECRH